MSIESDYHNIIRLGRELAMIDGSHSDRMIQHVAQCAEAFPSCEWEPVQQTDWSADVFAGQEWLSRLLREEALPSNVVSLWVDVPRIEMNPANIYLHGCDGFDPDDEDAEWASSAMYSRNLVINEFEVPSLADMRERISLDPKRNDQLLSATPPAVVASLLIDALPEVADELLFGYHRSLGVGVGFASGGILNIGWITPDGWTRLNGSS